MKLEDIYYFLINKQRASKVFMLAQRVETLSSKNLRNQAEFQRRLYELSRVAEPNGEQRRQAVNFLCEMIAFEELSDKGADPLWVPEMVGVKTPDIEYESAGEWVFVEVKHLNSPRDEDVALSEGRMYGGAVNHSYELGLVRKLDQFINSAADKYRSYKAAKSEPVSNEIMLRLFFSESIDAFIIGSIPWEKTMREKIEDIANPLLEDPPVSLYLSEINASVS